MNVQIQKKNRVSLLNRIDVFKLFFFSLNTLGLGVTRFGKLTMADHRVVTFSLLVLMMNVMSFVIVQLYGSLEASAKYTTISQAVFWILYYGKFTYIVILSFRTLRNRNRIFKFYLLLTNIAKDFKTAKLNMNCPQKSLKILWILIYCTFPFVLILDAYTIKGNYTILILWCLYVPSMLIILHMLLVCLVFSTCTHRYKSINAYINQFTMPELSSTERITLTLQNLDPGVVNGKITKESGNFKQIFILHDKLYKVVKQINKLLDLEILFFLALSAIATMNFLYVAIIDLIRIRRGIYRHSRTSFAYDYFGFLSMCLLFIVIYISSNLMKHGNDTNSGLHLMRSIFPKLNELVNVYSFQLMHEELYISAAGFFVINFNSLYSFVGTLGTYLFILIQLDNGLTNY